MKNQTTQHASLAKAIETSSSASAADSHPFLEAMIANTSDVIIALDAQFRVLDLNPAASIALGYSPEEAIGRHCSQILHCQNLNHIELCGTSRCPLVRVLQGQEALPGEELILGATSDHLCEVSLSVTPVGISSEVEEGIATHAVFVARDLSAMNGANRVRANFVSMVSHELRTPLNSVYGFIDLLLQGHMGTLTREQQKYLGYAHEGVQQLISIVEDILFLTRSDLGQFEIKEQTMNLRVLARQVTNSLQPQAKQAGVALTKDIPSPSPMLYADPQRIKQVLNNLVMNAIKFTPPGGTVTIRARPYNEQFAMVSVIDTGFGIAVEDRPHIFERFYQSNHHLQSRMGGNGLGLAITKLIVEQHGGSIGFDTVVNKGTTFYFTVPLSKG